MEHPKKPLIFSAMNCGDDMACKIEIWQKNLENLKEVEEKTPQKAQHLFDFKTLLQGCMLLMAAAFIWQNVCLRFLFKLNILLIILSDAHWR